MTQYAAICQDDTFWNEANWTTSDGTVITNATERDSYYYARFTTVDLWLNSKADLTEPEVGEICGAWEGVQPAITFVSTKMVHSPSNRLRLTAVGIAKATGIWRTSGAYTIESSGRCVYMAADWCDIDGIQINCTSTESSAIGIYTDPGKRQMIISNCYIKGGRYGIEHTATTGGGSVVFNNVIEDAGYRGIQLVFPPSYAGACWNNTIIKSGDIGLRYKGLGNCWNNLVMQSGSSTYGDILIDNGGDDQKNIASGSKGDGLLNQSPYNIFTDYDNKDYSLKPTCIARNYALQVSDVKKGINGPWRDNTPDAGAFEYDTGYVPKIQVPVKLTNIVEGSIVIIERVSDGADIIPAMAVGESGIISTNVDYTDDTQVIIKVRKSSLSPKYKPYRSYGTITSSGLNVFVSQVIDLIAS